MTKTNEIRPGQATPAQQAQTTQTLNDKEQAKALQHKAKTMSPQDAARVASQAGFARGAGVKKKGFDVGDSSHSPIPLPDDDVDGEVWSQERLQSAQETLTLANAQLAEMARAEGEAALAEGLVGSSFLPTESDVERLEELSKREAPEPVALEEASSSVERLFHIPLPAEVPTGHRMVAMGLVVAGEKESVHVEKGGLNEQKLTTGLQRVTERSNQAVGEAQRMNKGITKELSVQRTFVFKR